MLSSRKSQLQWWLLRLPRLSNCLSLLDTELMKREWMFGSNPIKIKPSKDWNEIIHKIHFSSELPFKRAKFIKLVKSTFHGRWLGYVITYSLWTLTKKFVRFYHELAVSYCLRYQYCLLVLCYWYITVLFTVNFCYK